MLFAFHLVYMNVLITLSNGVHLLQCLQGGAGYFVPILVYLWFSGNDSLSHHCMVISSSNVSWYQVIFLIYVASFECMVIRLV